MFNYIINGIDFSVICSNIKYNELINKKNDDNNLKNYYNCITTVLYINNINKENLDFSKNYYKLYIDIMRNNNILLLNVKLCYFINYLNIYPFIHDKKLEYIITHNKKQVIYYSIPSSNYIIKDILNTDKIIKIMIKNQHIINKNIEELLYLKNYYNKYFFYYNLRYKNEFLKYIIYIHILLLSYYNYKIYLYLYINSQKQINQLKYTKNYEINEKYYNDYIKKNIQNNTTKSLKKSKSNTNTLESSNLIMKKKHKKKLFNENKTKFFKNINLNFNLSDLFILKDNQLHDYEDEQNLSEIYDRYISQKIHKSETDIFFISDLNYNDNTYYYNFMFFLSIKNDVNIDNYDSSYHKNKKLFTNEYEYLIEMYKKYNQEYNKKYNIYNIKKNTNFIPYFAFSQESRINFHYPAKTQILNMYTETCEKINELNLQEFVAFLDKL